MAQNSPLKRKGIPIAWTKHLQSEEEKDRFISLLRNSTQLFTVLRHILQEEMDEMERIEFSLSDFESTDWAFKQAYRNGYRAAMLKQMKMTNFIERN